MDIQLLTINSFEEIRHEQGVGDQRQFLNLYTEVDRYAYAECLNQIRDSNTCRCRMYKEITISLSAARYVAYSVHK